MGLFSFHASFLDSYGRIVPADLLYPAPLPHFDELAEGGHNDPRAIVYTILLLGLDGDAIHSSEVIRGADFGKANQAYRALVKMGLIQEIDQGTALALLYEKNELKALLKERRLPVTGTKAELCERLSGSGFKIDRKKYRHRLFNVTERGAFFVEEYRADEAQAILLAMDALKKPDYSGAISAYRTFDKKWGFVHTSGKNHTIFANYDIPSSRFKFIESYPMRELRNSDDFKRTLRGCLLAGLMRGCHGHEELARWFEKVCAEQIRCPHILNYFTFEGCDFHETVSILGAMRRNIKEDNRYALEYYISHLMYLSRRS